MLLIILGPHVISLNTYVLVAQKNRLFEHPQHMFTSRPSRSRCHSKQSRPRCKPQQRDILFESREDKIYVLRDKKKYWGKYEITTCHSGPLKFIMEQRSKKEGKYLESIQ